MHFEIIPKSLRTCAVEYINEEKLRYPSSHGNTIKKHVSAWRSIMLVCFLTQPNNYSVQNSKTFIQGMFSHTEKCKAIYENQSLINNIWIKKTMIFFTKLLYRDAASLCVCVCLTVLSFYFDTAVGLRPKLALIIWTDLRIVEPKKLPLPRQGGFEGVTFKKFGRCHELQRKSIHLFKQVWEML